MITTTWSTRFDFFAIVFYFDGLEHIDCAFKLNTIMQFSINFLEVRYVEIWELYEKGHLRPCAKLTGVYNAKRKNANVREILDEIKDAREEAEAKARMAEAR